MRIRVPNATVEGEDGCTTKRAQGEIEIYYNKRGGGGLGGGEGVVFGAKFLKNIFPETPPPNQFWTENGCTD